MGTAVALNRLVPPRLSSGTVQRARLAALLDAATSRPLTVVTGSAGAGKTTLMSAWAHERDGMAGGGPSGLPPSPILGSCHRCGSRGGGEGIELAEIG
jgi:hypothetical protein